VQLPPSGPPQNTYNQQFIQAGSSGLAIASGIIGILSWFVCPFVGALVAILTGHIALSELRRKPYVGGRGWALVGVILGYAHLAIYSLVLVIFFAVCGGIAALNSGH
jgi:hypothetical protein